MKLRITALLVVGALLLSCGFGRQATGVVVWAPEDSPVKNGDVVWIWEQSRIRHSYKIQPTSGSAAFETDLWRVKSFAGEGDALAFAKSFLPLSQTWAVSGKQGLPVRVAADANSDRVYKLGEGEEVKVITGNGPRVKQGNLEGSWVEILTKDGYNGWVFDYYLTLVDKSQGAPAAIKASGPGDELVQRLLTETWFPEEMRAMVEQDRLRPEVFRSGLGLRLQATATATTTGSFVLVLPSSTGEDDLYELPWEVPRKIDNSSYWFGGPSKLRIQFTSAEYDRIALGFTWKGAEKTVVLITLPQPVGNYLSRELASRQQKWAELKNHGSTLTSPTYGTLLLGEAGEFTWTGMETLQPPLGDVLPTCLPEKGTMIFDWFRERRFISEFRAVRFVFGESEEAPSQVFLYRFLKDGLQLLPVAAVDLDPSKNTVLRESRGALSLFFTIEP